MCAYVNYPVLWGLITCKKKKKKKVVEDQVADVIDDVLKLCNHARHPTQLGIWQCARPIFPV